MVQLQVEMEGQGQAGKVEEQAGKGQQKAGKIFEQD